MGKLDGKIALITGAASGIGRASALAFAHEGASVGVADWDEAGAKQVAQEIGARAFAIKVDVARAADVQRMVAATVSHFGRLDILFNNAGINIRKPPAAMSLEDWQTVIDVNLTSAFLMSQAVYPAMKKEGGGKIINIGSMTSIFGAGFAAPYSSSKGGIVQLSKSLALAWAADNIQVNALLPGWFETDLTDRARQEVPGLYERVLARIAVGRWAKPQDIAGTAVWLASPASDYITGIAVPVDGGYTSSL
jgi:2-deoxy-D-gluconate 3-dehydrogenase